MNDVVVLDRPETSIQAVFRLKSPNTQKAYLNALKGFETVKDWQTLTDYILASQTKVENKEMSANTYNLMINGLRGFYKLTGQGKIFDTLKAQGIKLRYTTNKKTECLNFGQIRSAVENTKDKRQALLIAALFQSGCRISELLSIRFKNCLKIENNDCYFEIIGKGKKIRQIAIKQNVIEALKELQCPYSADNYLFYTNKNQPLNRVSAYRWVKQVFNALGLHARPHILRHSIATYLLESGQSIKAISTFLGHSSTSITSDFYIHSQVDRVQIPEFKL